MTKQLHTPGPWWPVRNGAGAWDVKTYRDDCENPQEEVGYQYGASICSSIGDHTEKRTRGNELANAQLIAAAPELLAALGMVDDFAAYIEGEADTEIKARNEAWIAQARAAIAKATGQAA